MNFARICRAIIGGAIVLTGSAVGGVALDCDNAEDQASLNACANEDYKAADAKLNETYKKVMGRLSDLPEFHAALTKAQRAWIVYRDAECAFVTSAVAEASAYPMIANSCLASLARTRVQDLEEFLTCEEGDLSCPVPSE